MCRNLRYLIVLGLAWLGPSQPASAAPGAQSETGPTAERRIAVTVDDLPVISTTADAAVWADVTARLVETFRKNEIPAIGFVNETKLASNGGDPDPVRVALLGRWLEAGLELGNHGFAHLDLHRVPAAEFEADVLRGERVLRPLLARRGLEPRFFRHPYLHTGTDLETRDRVATFLEGHGYRVAPVTVDNSDWIFARAYDHALDRGDEAAATRVVEAYGPYMEAMVAFYEDQSRAILGREIPLVLLVHANRLNAAGFDDVARRLRTRGYTFVSLDDAVADPAYTSEDRYVGRGGISWLHRWAITRGVAPSTFRGEPTTPEWVQELAGISE
ncbi:MAG TPA: polysaccharide deacetylase family protein [Thermoanaerobaculia bacterium]|nr:polysaccharide deacetylase family protein [Thermoanaerobaculia bacterium]